MFLRWIVNSLLIWQILLGDHNLEKIEGAFEKDEVVEL
jgi:hypothetical protein